MKQQSKYYTPDITEFCVGFEYEWSREGEGATDWTKSIMANGTGPIGDLDAWIINKYRVKYLDSSDIEELGFTRDKLLDKFDKTSYRKDDICINLYHDNTYHRGNVEIKQVYDVDCIPGRVRTLFSGDIKNKTELKKLLTQLGITE